MRTRERCSDDHKNFNCLWVSGINIENLFSIFFVYLLLVRCWDRVTSHLCDFVKSIDGNFAFRFEFFLLAFFFIGVVRKRF